MTKREMMTAVAQKAGITVKEAERITGAFLETIEEELQTAGKVSVAGFGAFKVRQRKARLGRNPRTGDSAAIPAGKAVSFKAGSQLKKKLNN